MKKLLTLLLTMVAISTSFAQLKGVDCLNMQESFELFKRQIKLNAKSIPVNHLIDVLPDSIYMKVDLTKEVAYDYLIKGVRILIINSTNKELEFLDAGVVSLLCQAKDDKGKWQDIEWRRKPWNCYGTTITLDKNSYLEAVAPCYQGSRQYMMRYKFTVSDQTYYSNEFPGNINPEQLIKT